MANGSLERRVEKLEKNGGGASDFDVRLRKFCDRLHADFDQTRNAVKGHEAKIHMDENGAMTYECFRVVARCFGVAGA
ncbi:MAG: hypothetical protein ACR2JB_00660 [Bryobacteraceae bacterium]